MILKVVFLLYFTVAAINGDNADENIPSTECPRFSVNEFFTSLFQPLFMRRIEFVHELVKASTDGVEEMLVKMEQKKGNGGDIAKLALNGLREKAMLALHKAKFNIEHLWRTELDLAKTLTDHRNLFKSILDKLDETESDLTQVFAEMVVYTMPIIDPAVEVIIKMIQAKPTDEQKAVKDKLINSFETRDKLLGHVMGQLVHAKLEHEVIPQELIFGHVLLLMKELNDDFYMKARRMPIDKFWKQFLIPHWNLIQTKPTEQENLHEMISILKSMFYHKPTVSDKTEESEEA